MKVVILAGGLGTRLSEETHAKPKPMVEIGGMPILWHIMQMYSSYGFNEFIICGGYKGYVIKEFFANYYLHASDIRINLRDGKVEMLDNKSEPWSVTIVDTGEATLTSGRLQRVQSYIGDEPFCMTYGDGLSDVNIHELCKYHSESGRLATVTAVQPAGRFGSLRVSTNGAVEEFIEKPEGDNSWINGGFFVLEPGIFNVIENPNISWERGPLEKLASIGQLSAFKHPGFWQPMDTLRDKRYLEELWERPNPPWKTW